VHEDIFEALLALALETFDTRQQIEEALAPRIPDPAVRRFLLKGLARNESGGFRWRFNLPALHRHYPLLNEALRSKQHCNRPTLFIRGAQSNYIRDEDRPEIRRLFPRSEIVTIPDASHWVHAEAPTVFVQIANEFLARAADISL
jgi:pimeloyl-ACP methyl ester carboxylesterase